MSNSLDRFAVVFPGQGSQSVGMMSSFADSAVTKGTFEEASEALGQDLWEMVAAGPSELLAQTVNTQPVMLTAGMAVWREWLAAGGAQPAMMAGHSLGEYAALVAAGALDFGDTVRLVRFRAEVMQEAVPLGEGGMAAVLGLEAETVNLLCTEVAGGQVVSAANLNSPGQIVIAGHRAAVERAMEAAKKAGAKRAVLLPVSAPFHCALMTPAAHRLAERLAVTPVAEPLVPVLNNVDVKFESSAEAIRDALVRQAYSPVRWIETVQSMRRDGVGAVLEFGPGKVLAGLVKRICGDLRAESVADADAVAQLAGQFKQA